MYASQSRDLEADPGSEPGEYLAKKNGHGLKGLHNLVPAEQNSIRTIPLTVPGQPLQIR